MRVGVRVLAVWSLCAACSVASAQEPLVPTRSQAQVQRGAAISRDLERSIGTLRGVSEAHVHVTLPTVPAYADGLEAPRASVLVHTTETATPALRDAVQRLVAGAVPGLNPEAVTVVDNKAVERRSSPPAWVRVGPFEVRPESAAPLRYTLIALLGLQCVLALLLAKRVRRDRRA